MVKTVPLMMLFQFRAHPNPQKEPTRPSPARTDCSIEKRSEEKKKLVANRNIDFPHARRRQRRPPSRDGVDCGEGNGRDWAGLRKARHLGSADFVVTKGQTEACPSRGPL
ncbi:hypothetical protein CPAR01_11875 [Colletotrichum paranaense]|uniref:Uncharacterized protein n=1 Tax=Colletotrichum paranaense TaxID=1914294 RepID=A0ABQ9S8E4_9PEZI|nr:uncharacterized protein CPAR01_11875 [Colletotrichum paranaense]KAK1529563.1 hypothetical protein CPAR01_11875 [Colletotrichum paranaense]